MFTTTTQVVQAVTAATGWEPPQESWRLRGVPMPPTMGQNGASRGMPRTYWVNAPGLPVLKRATKAQLLDWANQHLKSHAPDDEPTGPDPVRSLAVEALRAAFKAGDPRGRFSARGMANAIVHLATLIHGERDRERLTDLARSLTSHGGDAGADLRQGALPAGAQLPPGDAH